MFSKQYRFFGDMCRKANCLRNCFPIGLGIFYLKCLHDQAFITIICASV